MLMLWKAARKHYLEGSVPDLQMLMPGHDKNELAANLLKLGPLSVDGSLIFNTLEAATATFWGSVSHPVQPRSYWFVGRSRWKQPASSTPSLSHLRQKIDSTSQHIAHKLEKESSECVLLLRFTALFSLFRFGTDILIN